MLNHRRLALALLLVAVLVFAVGCTAAAQTSTTSNPPNRTITVVGTGKAAGSPDVAEINIGVETRSESVQQAAADNTAQMNKILEAIKKLGIADKDIRTSNYSVYGQRVPDVKADGSAEGPVVYHVNNQLNVTVRDLTRLGDVLDQAVAAGANNVYGIGFRVADPSKLEADARTKAVADAKARAESLATLTGVQVGDVLSISEVIGGSGIVAYETARGMGAATPIQPGELEVSLSVQVTYAIR